MILINLTIPLYNEETTLEENVRKILDFIARAYGNTPLRFQIILADNASTDKTAEIAKNIVRATPCVCPQNQGDRVGSPLSPYEISPTGGQIKYLFIPQKGKGLAIKTAWQKFPADYYVFMDADLSTDLEALPRLIEKLDKGADVVIGSRYLPESKTTRSASRKFISLIYRGLAKIWLGLPFSDLPCGFKGINQKIVCEILPLVKNNEWFFDTELLYRAYQEGCNIKEIPVQWTETVNQKRKSRVGIVRVGLKYLWELFKINSNPKF